MKLNQFKAGTILSYLQLGLGAVINLLYTPIMLRILGPNEYGLYNTVASTISMLSILNLGFGSSYIRYYAVYKKDNDWNAVYKLNGLFLGIFLVIGSVALLCGLFLANNLELIFADGLAAEELILAEKLMVLLTINLAISFPMSVFTSIISANERFVFLKGVGILKTVVSPLMCIPLLLAGHRSLGLVLCTLAISMVVDILNIYYVLYILGNRFVAGIPTPGILKDLFAFTAFIAINIIVDQINTNLDKVLLARYNGTVSSAVYSVGFQLYQYFVMFSTAISSVHVPKVHMCVQKTAEDIKQRKEELTSLFTRVGRLQFIVLGLIASGLCFFGRAFITIYWAGPEYEDSYFVMLMLVLPAIVPLIQNLGIEIQRAQNKHQFRSEAYMVMAIVNYLLTIVLCPVYGALGAAAGTMISLILANGFVMNIYYHKHCQIDILSFWRSIFSLAKGLWIPVGLGIVISPMLFSMTLPQFLGAIILYSAVYTISMVLLGMNTEEKNITLGLFNACLKAKRGNHDRNNK